MCIRVEYAPLSSVMIPWDPRRGVVTIPDGLHDHALALRAVQAVLAEVAIPQPDLTGAVCWCGATIDLNLPPLIPEQRQPDEVIHAA